MKQKHQQKFSTNFNRVPKSFIREILNMAGRENLVSFAGGLPNPEFFPIEALKQSAIEVFNEKGKEVLQYAGSQGYLPLREWIANRYIAKYKASIDAENVVITNGSQQTIDVVAKMFINRGDRIIIEKPSYLGGIQALSAYSPHFLEVDLLPDGPDLEQIEMLCAEKAPKLMYGIPNFQNPSGVCYSGQKREALAKLLRDFDLLLLEDDPYNEIRFEGEDYLPVYAGSPEQVFWSGSFSKMVAPGLRMGWVVVPDGLAADFVRAKQATDLHSNNLSQYVLHHFLTNYNIDQHLAKIRQAYKAQCDCMMEMLKQCLPDEVSFNRPQGGMFLWLTLPSWLDSDELIKRTLNKGVVFVPGRSFFVSPGGNQHIRLNFSNACSADIEKGIAILADEMKKTVVLSR
jgi:2-aminoadipate transaminase